MTVPVQILKSSRDPMAAGPMEVVERKGVGHPDTICDAAMERVALALTRAYREACGRILHFNVDKGMLVAGVVDCRPGGGRVIEPMRMVIGDRATFEWRGKRLPIEDIAVQAVREWFKSHLRHVNPVEHVRCQVELRPGSAELQAVIDRDGRPVANDTSAAVGYAPLSPTERLVLGLERFLNGGPFKKAFPETGEDVKVLAVRAGADVHVTVAMPLLASAIRSEAEYFARKAAALGAIRRFVKQEAAAGLSVRVGLNTLDRPGAGVEGMYLSLLGTSAEAGDSGEVGRGNRVCGVISLGRPASAEAAAGKNPVAHVGKIYTVLAQILAEQIHRDVPGLREATVWLTSEIGRPIASPRSAAVELSLTRGVSPASVESRVRRHVRRALAELGRFCEALARGEYEVC
jgi:S-adenosylmethionine synthetase